MRYFSMFSGIGGFELGIGSNGECIGYSEIDKYAIQVYEKQFGGHKNYGNATKINGSELPDFDLLVGGFPCQSFSIAGKRKGFTDTRGTLFFDIARIIKIKRPKIVWLENVKGLLNHDKGQTFRVILETMDELGYDVEWQVLNSKHFGVPQNRERVFIIGHLRGTSRPKIFPIKPTTEEINRANGFQSDANERLISRTLLARDYKDPKLVAVDVYNKKLRDECPTLTDPCHNSIRIADFRNDEGLRIRNNNLSPCLNARRHSETDPSTMPNLVIALRNLSRNGRLMHNDGYCGSLQTSGKEEGILQGARIRRLTPIECERLQGFPDDWTKIGTEGLLSDTQRYKMCGNAVTVNVIQAIAERLL